VALSDTASLPSLTSLPYPIECRLCRSATVMKQFLADLATVKDIVDVVSPCSYYIQQVPCERTNVHAGNGLAPPPHTKNHTRTPWSR
jgi:hypothetical protein